MMKLLLAVIATCALVVSPTCIKIKHQLRSNAPTIHVLISNGNTQMTSQVGRNGSHRFITDNLSNMTLAPAGSQTIQLSYDEIFPITDAAVCTEVHPLSAGGCADGVCCKVSISMYTITDAIIMTARVNNRKADGNPQFWKCEQEIQVPGVTNTEPTGEDLAAEILHGENSGYHDGACVQVAVGTFGCRHSSLTCGDGNICECASGYGGIYTTVRGGICRECLTSCETSEYCSSEGITVDGGTCCTECKECLTCDTSKEYCSSEITVDGGTCCTECKEKQNGGEWCDSDEECKSDNGCSSDGKCSCSSHDHCPDMACLTNDVCNTCTLNEDCLDIYRLDPSSSDSCLASGKCGKCSEMGGANACSLDSQHCDNGVCVDN